MGRRRVTRRAVVVGAGSLGMAGLLRVAVAQEGTPGAEAGPVLGVVPEVGEREGGALAVVATTPLLADLVRQVGGARVEVRSILPANADPHEFEPAPQDIVAVEDAALVVEHGLNLDGWAADLVESSGTGAPVVTATDGVTTLATDEAGFEEGDPHVWFDPRNVQVMVATIASGLAEADPAGADGYAARRDAYAANLGVLDAWIAARITTIPPERQKLVTTHDALGYYVARYGLTYVGAVIPSIDSRAEPSAKETAELIAAIQAEGVPAIFTEASLNPRLEEELAVEAGVTVVTGLYADSLGEEGSGAETYIGMLVVDTNVIVGALR